MVSDNCTVVSITNNAPLSYPLGVTTVTWTATDNSGNIETATQTVTVLDNINPTIVAPLDLTFNANNVCSAFNVNLGTPVTSDNCSVASVVNNAPTIFPIGITSVTWTVTDGSGNTATATQTVTVIDTKTRENIKRITFKIPGIYKDKIQPVGIKLTSNGKYAFVGLGPANHVAVIDAKTYKVIKYLLVGKRVWQLGFTNNESKLYTANGVSGDISIIDIEKLKVEKSVKVGRFPWGIAVKPIK